MDNRAVAHLPGEPRLEAYYSRPNKAKSVVIVIHEVWGLTAHIKSVCKYLASMQIAALAPNLYSSEKSLFTAGHIREAMLHIWNLTLDERYDTRKVISLLERRRASPQAFRLLHLLYSRRFRAQMLTQLIRWAEYARSDYRNAAVIGFSMGGGLAFKLVSRYPLKSCTSVCGQPPEPGELRKIKAPMLTICVGRDDFMNSSIPKFGQESLRQRKNLTLKVYGGAKHEFFNDADPGYEPALAADCWNTITHFLRATLGLNNL